MKRLLLIFLVVFAFRSGYGQTVYYWVGGSPSAANINMSTNSNWNTVLNGTGSARSSSTNASDILVFDGSNLGGATPTTGPITINANSSITCAQIKFINGAQVSMVRPTSGTTTITIAGENGDDFVIDETSALMIPVTTAGSIRIAMAANNAGSVAGLFSVYSTQQFRIDNTTSGLSHAFVFKSGSSFYTNITAGSSSYAFGSSSQSTKGWVVFESGSHLYYDGGYSPIGSGAGFSAIEMKPGSVWHHRANSGGGTFFNRQGFGDIILENEANLTFGGSVYHIGNLTVNQGSTLTTHSSGETVITGNVIVNGKIQAQDEGSNRVVFAGEQMSVSGSGTISLNNLFVANKTEMTLSKPLSITNDLRIYGKLNTQTHQVSVGEDFIAYGNGATTNSSLTMVAGNYFATGNTGFTTSDLAKSVTGAQFADGTHIVSFSVTGDTVYFSKPVLAAGNNVNVEASFDAATLATAHPQGFDAITGVIVATTSATYNNGISYEINGATSSPFGISSTNTGETLQIKNLTINAPIVGNASVAIGGELFLNGKWTVKKENYLHLLENSTLFGSNFSNNFIELESDAVNNTQAKIMADAVSAVRVFPIGTGTYYLPVTILAANPLNIEVGLFSGITENGELNGTPLSTLQKQTVVDAVWQINRTSGTEDAVIIVNWPNALEGSTFTTLPNTDIGIIYNNGTAWNFPTVAGNNTTNEASFTTGTFGSFSVGAVPQVDPFVFNAIPPKTYGDANFSGGATSLNTTKEITYASSNTDVAIIENGLIKIVGAGTTNITASQETDGTYPAANITQPLVVAKTPLEIKADNLMKFEGLVNPPLTITYTGFVYNESATNLLTPPVITTTATAQSTPGTYPITVVGASSNNYEITYVEGVMTVQAKQQQVLSFAPIAVKTYGNADFNLSVSSTNNTLPLQFASSNTSVATVTNGVVHIVGAGTTNITVSQAGNDGYFAAIPLTQTLTVNKVNLTIRVMDTTKVAGQENPSYRITYSGFVSGENATHLSTAPTVQTTATRQSSAGVYPLVISGAVSQNYNIVYTNGKLTVLPATGAEESYLGAFYNNNGTITVRVYKNEPSIADVIVYDINGKKLKTKNLYLPKGFAQSDIIIPAIPSGIYIIQVVGPDINLSKKIQIIK